jgi:hypothetical protein
MTKRVPKPCLHVMALGQSFNKGRTMEVNLEGIDTHSKDLVRCMKITDRNACWCLV